jgi:hypothetical protein
MTSWAMNHRGKDGVEGHRETVSSGPISSTPDLLLFLVLALTVESIVLQLLHRSSPKSDAKDFAQGALNVCTKSPIQLQQIGKEGTESDNLRASADRSSPALAVDDVEFAHQLPADTNIDDYLRNLNTVCADNLNGRKCVTKRTCVDAPKICPAFISGKVRAPSPRHPFNLTDELEVCAYHFSP